MSEILGSDCAVLGAFPNAPSNSWSELLTAEDRAAYVRVHRALKAIAEKTASRAVSHFKAVTTSGFFEASGVRNTRPKDLWCVVVNDNASGFVDMPQVFMIASGRGIEIGFAFAIHRSDFSDQRVKQRLRNVIPALFSFFPAANDPLIDQLDAGLTKEGSWSFREKTRLDPGAGEFASLAELIGNIHSEAGTERGSGAISRYFSLEDLDASTLSLQTTFDQAFDEFRPLMEVVAARYALGADYVEMAVGFEAAGSKATVSATGAFNPQDPTDGRRRILASITVRQGQGAFRFGLLAAYGGRCAVTGSSTIQTLEAAHIRSYDGPQTNDITNGLLLRADIHTLFDLGLITLTDDHRLSVSTSLLEPDYRALDGQKIRLPKEASNWPSQGALSWHRKNVAKWLD